MTMCIDGKEEFENVKPPFKIKHMKEVGRATLQRLCTINLKPKLYNKWRKLQPFPHKSEMVQECPLSSLLLITVLEFLAIAIIYVK